MQHGTTLDAVSISFCSNNFSHGDKRISDLLITAFNHILSGRQTLDELRLVYNLLQFHPESISGCESPLCESVFDKLVDTYNSSSFYSRIKSRDSVCWAGKNATQKAGYLIKCMLFILHRRRYDSQFLKLPNGWKMREDVLVPPGILGEKLPISSYYSSVMNCWVDEYNAKTTLPGHEAMRQSFIKYVNGEGKIEGIPLGD